MKKYGNKILKVTLVIEVLFIAFFVPVVFIVDCLPIPWEYVDSALKLCLLVFLSLVIVTIVLLCLGCRPVEKETENSKLKELYSVYGPVVMRVSIILCVLFLFFIVVLMFLLKEQKAFEMVLRANFIVSMMFGAISFLLLLFCSPKEGSNSEIYKTEICNFDEYNNFMEGVLVRNKFKRHKAAVTQQGCEIYVYKRKRASINYYFIINLKDLSDETSLAELEYFMTNVLTSESAINFGTVKASSIICVNKLTNDFEQKLLDRTKAYRLFTTLGIGVVFDEHKIYLPSCKREVRVSLLKTMKREFRELVGISKPISKNPIIRWIVGNSMDDKLTDTSFIIS